MSRKNWFLIIGLLALSGCHAAPRKVPTQVVYRFDDHRYLELTGFNCEGELWFTDTQRNIHSEVTSQFYRIFTKPYLHPSERYIAVTMYEGAGFFVSKDYGQTWYLARYTPGGGANQYGSSNPESDEIVSFTVINDQGFIQTKTGDLYMSSKPFDDPRLQPGGAGIPYTYRDYDGSVQHARLKSGSAGLDWGREYISWNAVDGPDHWGVIAHDPKWQNIPNNVPEVKNYTGWDHMQCNPDLGEY
ncbi:hypothetical protein NG99_07040 [Erwinia typographi]|uniref:Tli3-like domain-containing protein n=1 Tax=Erwinia typographi TaxID=371042 RepID=A0A0A4AA89_9GAMM|nr:hypothetical protein [Erwinia typographi]KGT94743.1 hypothetical protein NG99_07040 [Erwinia typographi]